MLNPIAQVIQDIRYNLITTETITSWEILDNPILKFIPIILVIAILVLGGLIFKKKSKYFAEEI